MIDLHTHILPNVDDGSSSLEESLALLRMLASQGVTLTAATPHFYATSDTPEQFFLRRESAWKQLSGAMESGMPCVLLGAEVAFYRNISQMQQLERFCIGSSRLLLIEMPFEPWSERVLAETLEISERGIQVMLAHVERYFRFQRADVWQRLSDRGVCMQTNANALFRMASAGKTLRMLRRGMIQFLASDCHNLKTRPPRMQEAARRLSWRLGDDFTADFFRREEQLLREGCAWYV